MQKFGIIGHPLGHTMSPILHNWGFKKCNLDAHYKTWPTEPEAVPAFMKRFRDEKIGGLSVTIPHKQTVMEYVDELAERAKTVGAVNTLYWNGKKLMGDNTDVAGVLGPIRMRDLHPTSALILGAGGASRAAVAACIELKVQSIAITNRTLSKAEELAKEFNIDVVAWDVRSKTKPDILINSTPLGMQGDMESMTPWDTNFKDIQLVFDLVYNPLQTRLLAEATREGCETIQGLEMFLYQGLEQFKLWAGKELDPEEARELLLKELGA